MSDESVNAGAPSPGDDTDSTSAETAEAAIPDESVLMGKVGVEAEVLAELARAEARLADPSAPDDPDASGAQV
jgi:hypothetical protein